MRYRSFILRVWRRQDVHGVEWAGRLASTQSGEEYRFRTLEELIGKLRQIAQADARDEAVEHETLLGEDAACPDPDTEP